jgi:hypothetical protein
MFPLISLILMSWMARTAGFADWMTKEFCSRSLVVGQIIMNEEVIESTERCVEVYRATHRLESGSSYVPGEELTLKINDTLNQYVFDVSGGAVLANGGCEGRRVANRPSVGLTMPLDPPKKGQVSIVAGWAEGHTVVKLTPTFILLPPNSSHAARKADSASANNEVEGSENVSKANDSAAAASRGTRDLQSVVEPAAEARTPEAPSQAAAKGDERRPNPLPNTLDSEHHMDLESAIKPRLQHSAAATERKLSFSLTTARLLPHALALLSSRSRCQEGRGVCNRQAAPQPARQEGAGAFAPGFHARLQVRALEPGLRPDPQPPGAAQGPAEEPRLRRSSSSSSAPSAALPPRPQRPPGTDRRRRQPVRVRQAQARSAPRPAQRAQTASAQAVAHAAALLRRLGGRRARRRLLRGRLRHEEALQGFSPRGADARPAHRG